MTPGITLVVSMNNPLIDKILDAISVKREDGQLVITRESSSMPIDLKLSVVIDGVSQEYNLSRDVGFEMSVEDDNTIMLHSEWTARDAHGRRI
jgi:outer membrane lipopolysaccharide assembly protein LptE/RlpB